MQQKMGGSFYWEGLLGINVLVHGRLTRDSQEIVASKCVDPPDLDLSLSETLICRFEVIR